MFSVVSALLSPLDSGNQIQARPTGRRPQRRGLNFQPAVAPGSSHKNVHVHGTPLEEIERRD